jgi:allantoinase
MMLVVRGQRVVVPGGERPASIHIDNGVIVDVRAYGDVGAAADLVDAGPAVVMPGLVDSHVHVNEPGRTDWEGFDTATRAAAAGGVTTIVDMPLNSVPATTTVAALTAKRDAARGQCHVDVGFWGGIVPGNHEQIEALLAAGVRGFKCFMTPSGVDEFASVSEADLRRALPVLARSAVRRPLLVHAEDPSLLKAAHGDPRSYSTFLATRPADAEVAAIRTIAALAGEYRVAAHIVHVSSAEGVDAVAAAQSALVNLSAETCPHYLTFEASAIPNGATSFKCAPPIRSAWDRDGLWRALERGVFRVVASDHSPAPRTMKHVDSGDFTSAWGGIASLELSLKAVWSGAARRGFTLTDVVRWMSEGPARLAGLDDRKGAIQPGHDADFVLFDPDAEMTVNSAVLQQRHKLTPYDGCVLRGAVRATYLRGVKVWGEGRLEQAGKGSLV